MEVKAMVNGKKEPSFFETPTGQVVLLAATSILSGFCLGIGGGIYNKVTGTSKSVASRENNVIDLRASKAA